jgi:hypothetical protein
MNELLIVELIHTEQTADPKLYCTNCGTLIPGLSPHNLSLPPPPPDRGLTFAVGRRVVSKPVITSVATGTAHSKIMTLHV